MLHITFAGLKLSPGFSPPNPPPHPNSAMTGVCLVLGKISWFHIASFIFKNNKPTTKIQACFHKLQVIGSNKIHLLSCHIIHSFFSFCWAATKLRTTSIAN